MKANRGPASSETTNGDATALAVVPTGTVGTEDQPEDRFDKTLKELTELVKELIGDVYAAGHNIINPIAIDLGSAWLNQRYNKVQIIQGFVKYSHPHWDMIKDRNEIFFSEHASAIFGGLAGNHVDTFKTLFTMKDRKGNFVIAQDDRNAIWDFFDSMVKISIRYVFKNRKPSIRIDNEGKAKAVYLATFFDEIPLERHAKRWDIKLEFRRQPAA